MGTNEYNDKSMNFRRIRRFLLDWLTGGEGPPSYPWQAYDSGEYTNLGETVAPAQGPLVIPPGLLWFNGPLQTLTWNYEVVDFSGETPPGLLEDVNGNPTLHEAARMYQWFTFDQADGICVVEHPLQRLVVHVQVVERIISGMDTLWHLFDPIAAGGSVAFTDNTVTVDTNTANFSGFITLVG